jgi:hypothetical protein
MLLLLLLLIKDIEKSFFQQPTRTKNSTATANSNGSFI